MKKAHHLSAAIAVIAFIVSISSCSTCYECYNQIPLIDANTGDTIDYTTDTDEFCTANAAEVTQKEEDGATCQAQ